MNGELFHGTLSSDLGGENIAFVHLDDGELIAVNNPKGFRAYAGTKVTIQCWSHGPVLVLLNEPPPPKPFSQDVIYVGIEVSTGSSVQ